MNALKQLLPLLKPYWKQITLAFVSLTLVVVTDLMIPLQIERVIDDGISVGNNSVIINSSLLMVGLAIISMVMAFANTYYSIKVSESVAADLRDQTYHQVQTFSFANLDTLSTGELLVRLTSDINAIKNAITMVMRMVFRAPLMLFGALIILIVTSPTLSISLAILLPLTVFIVVWYSMKTSPLYTKVQARLDRINTILQENIAGVRVVHAFVRGPHEQRRFADANASYTSSGIEVNQIVALLMPTMLVLINLATTAIIYFGGNLAISVGSLTTGELVAFVNYLAIVIFPVLMLGMVLPQIYAANASAERLNEVIKTKPTVVDKPNAIILKRGTVQGKVQFENVSFDYDGEVTTDAVLKHVSFLAEPGETVAILGATGSGKTSLVNLIPRLYDAVEGRITIDGIDVRNISQKSLRQNIGYALQEAVLFSGTVADNIRYGRPEATGAELLAVAEAAQAARFIESKPDGFQTHVEQRGQNFSGGQKQRLAIARALAVRPPILILDDSTSAVDVETETLIQDALAELMQDSTTFVVAQRISTVLSADKILVLDNGRVAAVGNHHELLQTSAIYQEIYHSQLGNGNGPAPLEVHYA